MREKGFAPLIIILIIAILGVVGYFGYSSLGPSPVPNDTNLPESTTKSNTPENLVPDENNIYKNADYGFRFEYNKDSEIKKDLQTNYGLLVDVGNDKFEKNGNLDDVVYFGLEVSKTGCDYWMQDLETSLKTIAGINTAYFEGPAAYNSYRRSACLTKDGYSYFFVQDIYFSEHIEELGVLFNEILSTFKFTK